MKPIHDIFYDYAWLDDNGRHINGSDKATNHNYAGAYEHIIGELRTEAKLIMEIGVAEGYSLLAWREVFPNAMCVGMDIHPSHKAHGDRIEFYVGDQCLERDCEKVTRGRLFDFICEDASHKLCDTLSTLLLMWPHVRPGGLYVIEDFHTFNHLRVNFIGLFPFLEIIDTISPFGGVEPLAVFRKKES